MSVKEFRSLFKFVPEKSWLVGVERECFTCDESGKIVPQAHAVLKRVPAGPEFGYELSACQVETRVGPCFIGDLRDQLGLREGQLQNALLRSGLRGMHCEVGPEDMPLDVYPDPSGRYQMITANMPREILLAACRVIGTHIHIGMPDHKTALSVYNRVIRHCRELCDLGDNSNGHRLAIYSQMAPDYEPRPYRNWPEYYSAAVTKGYVDDPRKCWTLIRISVHGTIEFRMFGATPSADRIVTWATRCQELCRQAL